MAKNEPYIDPQVSALLEAMWENPAQEIDWDNIFEEEVIAMRSPAATSILLVKIDSADKVTFSVQGYLENWQQSEYKSQKNYQAGS